MSASALAPLAASLTTIHRVISYTYDSLYRLISATYSSGEYYHYTYPSTSLRTGIGSTVAVSDAAGGEVGRVQYDPYGEVLTSTLPLPPPNLCYNIMEQANR